MSSITKSFLQVLTDVGFLPSLTPQKTWTPSQLLLNFTFGFSQNLDLIKKEVEQINNTKNFKIKTIPNDYFVDIKNEATDNGQELKGYYDKNQLKKIIHFVGLSAWNIVTEYYYKDNQLIWIDISYL